MIPHLVAVSIAKWQRYRSIPAKFGYPCNLGPTATKVWLSGEHTVQTNSDQTRLSLQWANTIVFIKNPC